jgi:hypothetical protein
MKRRKIFCRHHGDARIALRFIRATLASGALRVESTASPWLTQASQYHQQQLSG